MMSRPKTVFEKFAERMMNAFGRESCPQCGGPVKHEYSHPPAFVRDGVSGLRKCCVECGHTEIVWCRGGI